MDKETFVASYLAEKTEEYIMDLLWWMDLVTKMRIGA